MQSVRNAPEGNDEFAEANCSSIWAGLSVVAVSSEVNCTGSCIDVRVCRMSVKKAVWLRPEQVPCVAHSCCTRLELNMYGNTDFTIPLGTDLALPHDSGLWPAFDSGQSPWTLKLICLPVAHSWGLAEAFAGVAQKDGAHEREST